MTLYQFITKTNSSWFVVNFMTNKMITDEHILRVCEPPLCNLFNNDVFRIIDKKIVVDKTYENPLRDQQQPGILFLNNSYGKDEIHKKNYYKVIPNNPLLPEFLVPYSIKYNFNKHHSNKYVLFKFIKWKTCYPIGMLTEVIGDQFSESINIKETFENYKKYMLYCNNISIPLDVKYNTKDYPLKSEDSEDSKDISLSDISKLEKIDSIQNEYIFTIDSENTIIYDDAFSIINDERNNQTIIKIYISNVPIILNKYKLFDYLNDNMSSIYFPNIADETTDTKEKKIKSNNVLFMLGKKFSEECSLKESTQLNPLYRDVLCLEIKINNEDYSITNIPILSCKQILINKNIHYKENSELSNFHYLKLLKTTALLSKINKYKDIFMSLTFIPSSYSSLKKDVEYSTESKCMNMTIGEDINSPKNLVSFWMMFMNEFCGKILASNNKGIFIENKNIQNYSSFDIPKDDKDIIEPNILKKINRFNSKNSSRYTFDINTIHEELNIINYIHITSPIRRMIDIINMSELLITLNLTDDSFNTNVKLFLNYWYSKNTINDINKKIKTIKQIQYNAELFWKCLKLSLLNSNKIYSAYVVHSLNNDMIIMQSQKIQLLSGTVLEDKDILLSDSPMDNKNSHQFKLKQIDNKKMDIDDEKYIVNNVSALKYKYSIYLPELNIFSEIRSNLEYEIYDKIKCKLSFINDKKNIYDKIKFTEINVYSRD